MKTNELVQQSNNETMKQLKLTNEELKKIGFEKCRTEADEMNPSRTYFKILTINGHFYYNTNDKVYAWYHCTIIDKSANHIHLDISKKAELFTLLQCFNVKFKPVF